MSQETAITEVVKRPSWAVGLTYFGDDAYTSLDLNTVEGRKAYVRCQQEECEKPDRYVNAEIAITHFLVHPAASTDETSGERHTWARCVLFTKEGKMIAFGSEGILKSLRMALTMFGPPPWDGLRGKFRQEQIAKDRRWYVIEWDLEQKVCAPKAKKTTPDASKKGDSEKPSSQ